jgi:intracellular septation protein
MSGKEQNAAQTPQGLRMLLELGPLVVFFLMNSRGNRIFGGAADQNIFYATASFMVATALSLAYSYARFRKIPTMPLVTGVFVMIFGTLTLVLHDDIFIKLKPTLVNLLFAAALLGAAYTGHPLLKRLFDGALDLTDEGWMILTKRWGFFFIVLAALNEIIWRNFSTEFWAGFKLFGILPLTVIFAMAQISVFRKHAAEKDEATGDAAD